MSSPPSFPGVMPSPRPTPPGAVLVRQHSLDLSKVRSPALSTSSPAPAPPALPPLSTTTPRTQRSERDVSEILETAILKQIRGRLDAKRNIKYTRRASKTGVFDTSSQVLFLHENLERTEEDLLRSLQVGQKLLQRTTQLNSEILSKNDQISGLRKEIDVVKAVARDFETQIANMSARNEEMMIQARKHARRQSNAHKQMLQFQEDMKAAETKDMQIEDLQKSLAESERSRSQLEATLELTVRQRQQLQSEANKLHAELDELRNMRDQQASELETAEIEYELLREKYARVSVELDMMRSGSSPNGASSTAVQNLQLQLRNLQDQLDITFADRDNLKNQCARISDELALAREKIQEYQSQNANLERDFQARLLAHTRTFVSMDVGPGLQIAVPPSQASPAVSTASVASDKSSRSEFVTPQRKPKPNNKNPRFRNVMSIAHDPFEDRPSDKTSGKQKLIAPESPNGVRRSEYQTISDSEDSSEEDVERGASRRTVSIALSAASATVSPNPKSVSTSPDGVDMSNTTAEEIQTDDDESCAALADIEKRRLELEQKERDYHTRLQSLEKRELDLEQRRLSIQSRESDALIKKEEAKKKGCCTVL
eukprot:ANDGO_00282.mRNA.1 hypothetical protein